MFASPAFARRVELCRKLLHLQANVRLLDTLCDSCSTVVKSPGPLPKIRKEKRGWGDRETNVSCILVRMRKTLV
jgi:hypothetical protein